MIPVDQDIFVGDTEGRKGNCFQACVASLLELPLGEVPHFAEYENWWEALTEWAESLRYTVSWEKFPLNFYSIATGKSPRGDYNHAVISLAGKTVHDPHPSRSGLEGEVLNYIVLYKPLGSMSEF